MANEVIERVSQQARSLAISGNASRMLASAMGVGILLVLGQASFFVADVLVARAVATSAEFGQYSFVKQAIPLIMSFAFLGLDQALVRVIARERLSDFSWRKTTAQIIGISSVLTTVILYFSSRWYALEQYMILIIGLGTVSLTVIYVISSILRADHDFIPSQILQNLWRYLHFLVVLLLYFFGLLSGSRASYLLLMVLLINAAVALGVVWLGKKPGPKPILLGPLYAEGVLFWLFLSSLTLANTLDQMLLAKFSSFSEVGEYAALWNILGAPFLVVSSSFGYVALPMVVRKRLSSVLDARLIGVVLVLGIGMVIWSFSVGDWLIDLVYDGKYQITFTLMSVFVATGVLRLVYFFPSTMLGGRADRKLLLQFACFAIAGVLVHGMLGWMLIPRWGIFGAGLASMANWTFRCGGGIALTVFNRTKLGASAIEL
jgi:O-antigen/teichoic acid export membrane protein